MNKVMIEGYVERIEHGKMILAVKRNSGENDYIPLNVPEHAKSYILEGTHVAATGYLKTENDYGEDGKMHKHMYIETECIQSDCFVDKSGYRNSMLFEGTICKKDVVRKTPLGRTLIDFVVAVNNPDTKESYYISCIAWSGSAVMIDSYPVGTKLTIKGRFQSRDYAKNDEVKTAYEISVFRFEVNS